MPHHGAAALSCHHPRSIETLYPTPSADWSARDVATAVERVRARAPPVRFYLYDAPVLPVSVRRELAKVERCGVFGPSGKQYHYGGEYWFLRSLVDHPWRVANASEAELLVIPSLHAFQVPRGRGGAPKSTFCRGLTPQTAITGAIMRTHEWRTRKADHVYVSLDWEYSCLPTPPSDDKLVGASTANGCMASAPTNTPTGDGRASHADEHPRTGGDEGAPRPRVHPRAELFHAFVEARWSDPMVGPIYRHKPPQPSGQRLLVAPYVDNGHGLEHHEPAQYAQRWAADELLAGAAYAEGAALMGDAVIDALPLPSDGGRGGGGGDAAGALLIGGSSSSTGPASATAGAAAPSAAQAQVQAQVGAVGAAPTAGSGGPQRNITFFFGGRSSRNIGPGKKGLGYYVRWALMRHWRREQSSTAANHAAPAGGAEPVSAPTTIGGVDAGTQTSTSSSSSSSSSSAAQAPGSLPRATPLLDAVMIVDSDRSRDRLEVPFCNASARGDASPAVHAASKTCLVRCEGLQDQVRGACHGSYRAAEMLRRARFALCLRGDIPSSPRPYDAIRYGAIPVFISDHLWRVGLPFQCWVPWRLLSHSIAEAAFLHDPGGALRNISDSTNAHTENRMRMLLGHFARDLLWRHPRSRVAENILLTAANARRRAAAATGAGGAPGASGDGGRRSRLPCCPLEDLDENSAEDAAPDLRKGPDKPDATRTKPLWVSTVLANELI